MQNRNPAHKWRVFYFRMTSHRAKVKGVRILSDKRRTRDKVQIHQVLRTSEAQLKQRNQALAAGQQLCALTKLAKHQGRFSERGCAVILEWSRIHEDLFCSLRQPYRLLKSTGKPQCRRAPPKGYNDPEISAISTINTQSMLYRPDIAIAAAEIKQRVAIPYLYVLDLRNENRVIAGWLRRMQPAFQVSERPLQDWRAMRRALKAGSRRLRMLMVLRRARIVFGNRLLFAAEHIHAKPLSRLEMGMCPGSVVHTDQHQHGVERDGRKSVCRHAVNLAVLIDGDDRDTGRKTPHRLAKVGRAQGRVAGIRWHLVRG